MKYVLEVIGFTIQSCEIAQLAGANRIELCDNPTDGGTTPSYGFIKAARKKLAIDLFPIIRPRGGDFFYSDDEFSIMKNDIKVCKHLGCDGIVTGILKADGSIDKQRCSQLVELAYPMEVTFHRAFDRTADAMIALEDVIKTGCTRILTSGLHKEAIAGVAIIKNLIVNAEDRIIIMPGSGVRSDNITDIATATGATEFHSSARTFTGGKMKYFNSMLDENGQIISVAEKEIKKMVSKLDAQFYT